MVRASHHPRNAAHPGHVALDDDTFRVETNSEKRMDRVLDVLRGLGLPMEVLDDSRHPVRDTQDPSWPSSCPPAVRTRRTPTTPWWPRLSTNSSAAARGSMDTDRLRAALGLM